MTILQTPVTRLEEPASAPPYAALAAVWAVLAGVIHLTLVRDHADQSWMFGAFFASVGVAQILLAVALRRPMAPRVMAAAIIAQVGVIALYVATRTTDLWFMPVHRPEGHIEHLPVYNGVGNGEPVYAGARTEPVGLLDLICLGAEVLVVVLLLMALPARHRRLVTSLMLWIGLGLLLLRGLAGPG